MVTDAIQCDIAKYLTGLGLGFTNIIEEACLRNRQLPNSGSDPPAYAVSDRKCSVDSARDESYATGVRRLHGAEVGASPAPNERRRSSLDSDRQGQNRLPVRSNDKG